MDLLADLDTAAGTRYGSLMSKPIPSILSTASTEDLRAELARRNIIPVDDDQQSLNDFSAWLHEEVSMFRFHVEERQKLDCGHGLPATMTFSEWIDLWFSDWQEEVVHEAEGPSPTAS